MLLRRESVSLEEAVQRLVALQAQEPASPYIALWTRLADFDPADLDRAFADRQVLKASLMRITLHAVHVADYGHFHEAMQPTLRAARLNDARFRVSGLTSSDADGLIPELLDFTAHPRSNAEVEAWLDRRLGGLPGRSVWWALRTYGPFVQAPTGGPWTFGARPAYLGAPAVGRTGDPDVALRSLVRRYLRGFGPATVQDIGQFALVHRPRVRSALEALGDELVTLEGPAGTLYDIVNGVLPDENVAAPPRLLPMWDSVLLAYADRSRVLPEAYRRLVTRSNGDVLPTVLVDGRVCGVWRPLESGIEVTAFAPLAEDAWVALTEEARSVRQLLAGRDGSAYRRYGRWWQEMPAADVRLLR